MTQNDNTNCSGGSVFKFVSGVSAVEHLLCGRLKFTRIRDLNDPSELLPTVDKQELKESLNALRQRGHSQEDIVALRQAEKLMSLLSPKEVVISAPSDTIQADNILQYHIYDNIEYMIKKIGITAENFRNKIGLFCASRTYDCLPMWAHYSNNAKGYVVEFAGLADAFPKDDTGLIGELLPVTYDRHISGVTFDPQSYKSIFLAKYPDWSYERERRIIQPLNLCETTTLPDRSEIYTRSIEKSRVRSLIFGWHSPNCEKEHLASFVNSINPTVKCYTANVDMGSVVLSDLNR
ncbi:DUF2971 domain-containing protein [uncultured Rhodospira sp.]|uniref:DUF2971 domain-containing protein n=1 Tax=uncultured Rhodospira sp. TaxID=1936189 RepID=UPI002605F979|nr:DUF2971 domain-containing protein [uncultured Rhodospira sp.]